MKQLMLAGIALCVSAGAMLGQSNGRLKALADADQRDRLERRVDMAANDAARLSELKALLGQGVLRTADDYYHAAILLQHSDSAADYLLAHDYATRAVRLKPAASDARTLIAQSWDRYQLALGKPQWYGTQRWEFSGKVYLLPLDTTRVSDATRRTHGVATLGERLSTLNEANGRQEPTLAAYIIADTTRERLLRDRPTADLVGGVDALLAQVRYPEEAMRLGITGTVTVEFTITPTGEVADVQVTSGVAGGCSEEVVRVIRSARYRNWSGATLERRMRVPCGPPMRSGG